MQAYSAVPQGAADTHAGLVLLYAADYEQYAPAYPFLGESLLVGRDLDASLCITGDAVSRHHARMYRKDGRWVLEDLGGRNGTIVDGHLVDEIALDDGQVIRFGDAIFKFVDRDAENHARYRIDGAIVEEGATAPARPALAVGSIVGGYQVRCLAGELHQVARSKVSVLLRGETGTGKGELAQQIHRWSRPHGPFKAVNCGAIPAPLLESELFGHCRGAFTGADRDRIGIVRAAHRGTLFLDEIGDMPLEAQVKLLRVIESQEVTPVGGTQAEPVDVRIVSATHRDLEQMQQDGKFRHDLFARLNEYPAVVPALRRRKEDLLMLCIALAARHGQPDVQVTFPFMIALLHYDFPYNVRDLEALIKRWAALARGPMLDVDALDETMKRRMETYGRPRPVAPPPAPPASAPQPPHSGAPTGQQLRALLTQHAGNVAAVARLLSKQPAQVYRWMKRYGIDVDDFR